MNTDFEQLPREALIRELQKRSEADQRMRTGGPSDPAVLIHELYLHQVELEMQNRDLLEAQLALEESRARYADLYNRAPVAIVTLDAHGIIRELNLTGASLLGAARDRLVGSGFSQLVVAGERSRFWTHLRRALRVEGSVSTELTLHVNERALSVRMIGASESESDGLTCRTSLVDITEIKQAELRLQLLSNAGQSFARSLDFRSTLGAVVRLTVPLFADACLLDLVDHDGAIERIEIVATDPNVARNLTQRVADHALQRAVITSGRAALFEQRPALRGASEPETHALWEALGARTLLVVPVMARGHTLGALTFVTSSSGRRFVATDVPFAEELARRAAMALDNARLYDQAQRAVQARENMLAVVSHDLQNPLSVILMRTDTLLACTGPESFEDAESIQRAARGMQRLIQDLLDLASMDAGTLSMRLEPWPLHNLVDDAVDLLKPLAAQQGVAIVTHLPDDALEVACDCARIMQVLANLLGNALKFTPRGGTITVSARADGASAQVTVADTGCGISEDQLPHIFDRYWRGEPQRRTGTGLGLSICKAILDAHHARIRAESRLGHGTTFHLTLPLAVARGACS